MAILNFPSITPDTQDFGIEYNTQVSTTTLSGITQTVQLPGARWQGGMSFRDMTTANSASLKAFLLLLRGASGRFLVGDLSHTDPFNNVVDSLTVQASSTSRLVRVIYAGGGSARLSVGDYVQLGTDDTRELKLVVAESLISGNTYDLQVEPMIRRTDYVGLSVVYTDPKGVFLLDSDAQATWAIRSKAHLLDINISFIEAPS